ncbi:phosphoesterase, partial [Streptomyces californicus]|nr:phosphoesterase [Streptomyces californicus]
MTNRAGELDRKMFTLVASTPWPFAQKWLPSLSHAANHGKLWGACAVVLAVAGDRSARRGALRGAGALAIASLVGNTVAKGAAHRRRPDASA